MRRVATQISSVIELIRLELLAARSVSRDRDLLPMRRSRSRRRRCSSRLLMLSSLRLPRLSRRGFVDAGLDLLLLAGRGGEMLGGLGLLAVPLAIAADVRHC